MSEQVAGMEWKEEELELVGSCPACGGPPARCRYHGLPDILTGALHGWDFHECDDCGSLFLDPRPTSSAIGKAYALEDYFTHQSADTLISDGGSSPIWKLANGYLNARFGCNRKPFHPAGRLLVPWLVPLRQQLDYFYRHLPRRAGRLLDVGCGNGIFLKRAIQAGWEVQGLEPDPCAANRARGLGIEVHTGDIHSLAEGESFDAITLSHVFEHLHEPASTLDRCRDLLKPGGMLWMAMPNKDGLSHAIYGQDWIGIDPPRHLFLPTQHALLAMCRAASYEQVHLVKRGRSGATANRTSSERAARRGVATGPNWLWRHLVDLGATFSDRWADEFVLVAYRPNA